MNTFSPPLPSLTAFNATGDNWTYASSTYDTTVSSHLNLGGHLQNTYGFSPSPSSGYSYPTMLSQPVGITDPLFSGVGMRNTNTDYVSTPLVQDKGTILDDTSDAKRLSRLNPLHGKKDNNNVCSLSPLPFIG